MIHRDIIPTLMPDRKGIENEPRYFNDANKQIWEALDSYFAQAGSYSYDNRRLIRPVIDRYGGAVILAGFSWVAERLEQEGLESAKAAQRGIPNNILTHNIIAVAKNSMNQLKDIVTTDSKPAGVTLAAIVGTVTDEDEIALAAYMLADGFAIDMDFMARAASRLYLKGLLKNIEGTSAKMAISWALYNMGNKKPWEEMVYGNFFVQRDYVIAQENIVKSIVPGFTQEEVKGVICRECAIPGSVFEDKMGIFEYLAIDIASDGQLIARNNPYWTRKAKG